jgi:hypothetical protein
MTVKKKILLGFYNLECNTLMFVLRNLTKVLSLNLGIMSLVLVNLIKIGSSPLKEIMENT